MPSRSPRLHPTFAKPDPKMVAACGSLSIRLINFTNFMNFGTFVYDTDLEILPRSGRVQTRQLTRPPMNRIFHNLHWYLIRVAEEQQLRPKP